MQWFGVAGLTLSCETQVDWLAAIIRGVRRASCNRAIGIMVGGPVFSAKPELIAQVGADASAADAPTAVLLAQRLLDLGTQQTEQIRGRSHSRRVDTTRPANP
ncbi:hypothetical protein GCM10007888_29570 [Methylobacterium oxalidis]|uniref:B12-binding domain-containing protein n=1 Tax=Methylobacterium oxalidis TaxID=944322 RepID=A0ABQ6DK96_9HYPH|nr:hypothetical protein GCM10007888_29570 [Methylobacterium oxalidis]